ncbi:MAG: type II secretion system protein GspC [Myxococcota bacterium]
MASSRQKRVMILVLLGTLMTCAFFLAQGTTSLLAASLLEVDHSVSVPQGSTAEVASARERKDDTPILRRNIFDGTPQDDESIAALAVTETPDEGPGEEPVEIDPNNLPACDGSMRLVAAIAHPVNENLSIAAIVGAAGKAYVYRPGQSVDDRLIRQVEMHRVVMQQSGQPCQLSMFGEEEGAARPARPTVAAVTPSRPERPERPARPSREGAISSEAMEAGINRVNDTTFNIDRSLVDTVLENQQELLRAARIIPHEENGRVVGVKMYGIRRNSLLGRLGVQNGDMLRTINGFDMSSPDSALEAYTRLRSADHLTLNIVRRGQPSTLDYNIQ